MDGCFKTIVWSHSKLIHGGLAHCLLRNNKDSYRSLKTNRFIMAITAPVSGHCADLVFIWVLHRLYLLHFLAFGPIVSLSPSLTGSLPSPHIYLPTQENTSCIQSSGLWSTKAFSMIKRLVLKASQDSLWFLLWQTKTAIPLEVIQWKATAFMKMKWLPEFLSPDPHFKSFKDRVFWSREVLGEGCLKSFPWPPFQRTKPVIFHI